MRTFYAFAKTIVKHIYFFYLNVLFFFFYILYVFKILDIYFNIFWNFINKIFIIDFFPIFNSISIIWGKLFLESRLKSYVSRWK